MFWEAFPASTKEYIVKYVDFIITNKNCFAVCSLNGKTHPNASKQREREKTEYEMQKMLKYVINPNIPFEFFLSYWKT